MLAGRCVGWIDRHRFIHDRYFEHDFDLHLITISDTVAVVIIAPFTSTTRMRILPVCASSGEATANSAPTRTARRLRGSAGDSPHTSQNFHFGPGTATVYTHAAPSTASFRAYLTTVIGSLSPTFPQHLHPRRGATIGSSSAVRLAGYPKKGKPGETPDFPIRFGPTISHQSSLRLVP
jgi:hypothetical protein